ncbi:MAG: 2-amino-4-hydroxy-6-hydroxymethyldihydropteridine diphosphokinase [Elusimicrobiales bacterium]|nr:2-amino-4-hydroxy-6-hydroxymethyldihydropteridine diphosphokinase [Elusimicrobiales bacterium]
MKVYLSLGSNLGDRLANLERALELLGEGGCRVVKRSQVYETEPLYYLKQPAFFNMAAACDTPLTPSDLLALIGRVERTLRRRRLFRNGPRTIDIDILFYGGGRLKLPGLEIPHPRLAEREFVLAPLAEIAPSLRHPVTGLTARAMLAALKSTGGVRRLPSSYAELEDWLRVLPPPSVAGHYNLKPIRAALARLGYPEKNMGAVVHITGSTAKTSAACMTAAALSANGWRTGLYTSPHIRSLRERVKVDGREISERDMLDRFLRVESVAAGELSFFETITAAAFLYFADKKTRFAVIEAGLGGRLDATNTVPGGVAGITSVSLEHTDLLGPRLADIAAHKAGIIKPGVDVLVGNGVPEEAFRVIARAASSAGAAVHRPPPVDFPSLSRAGAFQAPNAAFAMRAAALAAARAGRRFRPGPAALALRRALPPGRFQRLRVAGRNVIVDGAHNAEGVAALVREFAGRPADVCVAAFMSDKSGGTLAAALSSAARRLILTKSFSYRSAPPAEIRDSMPPALRAGTLIVDSPMKALERAVKLAPEGGTVLVAGSLYLAGDVLAGLRGHSAFHPREMPVKS